MPRRFLHGVAAWGVYAALIAWIGGDAMLSTRWHPATLAFTHAITLGVLANAMVGSLLQFLPAAAGVRLRFVDLLAGPLHASLNIGAIALCIGLHASSPASLMLASIALPTAFALLAIIVVPGLLAASGQRLLRAGIGGALVSALVAAGFGALLASARAGPALAGWASPAWVDVHAAIGVLGWVLLLVASIARVVMPMFQDSARLSAAALATWLVLSAAGLFAGAWMHLGTHDARLLRGVGALAILAFASTGVLLQWRGSRARGDALRAYWTAGFVALFAGALALARGADMLAGILVIGVGLPLLVVGMLLQICAFLAWIDLHRRCGRGMRVPGVQQLLPEPARWQVLGLQLAAAVVAVASAAHPEAGLVRVAALAMALACVRLALALHGIRRRAGRFIARPGPA